jgi:TonB family protein
MKKMFDAAPPRRRSPASVAVSLALHVGIVGAAISLSGLASSAPSVLKQSRTFLVFARPLPVPIDVPPRAPRPDAIQQVPPPEPPKPRLEFTPPPTPEVQQTRVEPPTPEPVPVRVEIAPRQMPAAPKRVPVVVGTFSANTVPVRMVEAARELRTAGFEPPTAKAPELTLKESPSVGTFERSVGSSDPRPGIDRPSSGVVTEAGFGNPAASPSPQPTLHGIVTDAGFGAASGGGRSQTSEPPHAAVRVSGFDAQPAPQKAAPPAPPPQRIDTPVEVVFKPTPDYTEEARALKLEGEVLLEVEFTASSQVRVLRVVRGLGHGLDESAVHAAEHMRFKPAIGGGRPIDFRTTVHIVFRLT